MTELSRRAWLRTALIVGGAGAAGCIAGPGGGDDETTPRPEGEIDDPPDLLVLADGETDGGNNHAATELSRLAYDEESDRYEVATTYAPDDLRITSFVPFERGYAVTMGDADALGNGPGTVNQTRLAVLDGEMEPRETRELSGHHTLATDGDILFTAYEDGFLSFDADLDQLGETSLPEDLAGKHMEDVLIHDGVAYVVDNVVVPMYLFRLDVSDPTAPSYLEVLETVGIGQSLHQQWLEPDANRWCFLQTTRHRGGGEQNVIVTPMDGAATGKTVDGPDGGIDRRADGELDSVEIHTWTHDWVEDDVSEDRDYGTRIEDVAGSPPIYAAVDDGEGYHLSSVGADGSGVSFGYEAQLDGPARVDTVSGLAVALSEDGTLFLFDTAEGRLGHVEPSPVDDLLELSVLTA